LAARAWRHVARIAANVFRKRGVKVAPVGGFGIVAAIFVFRRWRGADMDNPDPEQRGQNNMDYQEHEQTYNLFIKLTQWGTVIVAIILILMAIFLV
jgi:hypothetical protein